MDDGAKRAKKATPPSVQAASDLLVKAHTEAYQATLAYRKAILAVEAAIDDVMDLGALRMEAGPGLKLLGEAANVFPTGLSGHKLLSDVLDKYDIEFPVSQSTRGPGGGGGR